MRSKADNRRENATTPTTRVPVTPAQLGWRFVLFCSLVALGAYLLPLPNVLFLEQRLFGLQMNVRAKTTGYSRLVAESHRKIVLIPISESTFRHPYLRDVGSPLPRGYHARVLRELKGAGASVVVYDLLFDEPRPGDEQLAGAARDFRKVVWAAILDPASGRLQKPVPALLRASPYIGHPRTPHFGSNPTAENIEAFIDTPQGKLPALSVQAYQLSLGPEPTWRSNRQLLIGKDSLSLSRDGTFRIAYSGQPGKTFRSMPYEEVWASIKDNPGGLKNDFQAEKFKNSIVIIGDSTEINKDYGFTPMGRMWGMEIHAHAVASLLQGNVVRDAGTAADILAIIVLSALACLVVVLLPVRSIFPVLVPVATGFLVFNTWLIIFQSRDGALVVPVGIALLMTLGLLAERVWLEEVQRQRMSTVLSQYVGSQVAQSGVPSGEVTLVFTDIEGSSLLSEKHGIEFEEVRNAHFRLLREAAVAWNGFEVETAGDSLFVVFANAADAVRFAVDGQMRFAKHSWPAWLSEDVHLPGQLSGALPVRIGMNTGTPYISRDRNRLVFRGPATNRAARVMGAGHGGQILLSDTTWRLAKEEIGRDAVFSKLTVIDRGNYRLKGVGEDRLWEVFHPELFDPPPRDLRDEALES